MGRPLEIKPPELDERIRAYRPSADDIAAMPEAYWEVWVGLPGLPYEARTCRDGSPALCYEDARCYLWVAGVALDAYRDNPNTVFLVLMDKGAKDTVQAVRFSPGDDSLEQVIAHARYLNRDKLTVRRPK